MIMTQASGERRWRGLAGMVLAGLGLLVAGAVEGDTLPSTTGGASFSVMNYASRTTAYAVGLNSSGQLGAGLMDSRRIYPVRVAPSAGHTVPDFIAIASATAHTIALRSDGSVWAWGDNANGQLGNGTTMNADQPTAVLRDASSTPLTGVIAIAAGRDHSVAAKSDGTVWSWGNNAHGQLGDNSDATTTRRYPVQVLTSALTPLTDVRLVAASDVHTVALKNDGTVWAWGNNALGELGTGDTTAHRTAVQVQVFGVGINDIQALLARGTDQSARTLAQRSDGLWGWGDNRQCQLGDTAAALGNTTTPVRLTNLSALGVGLNALAQGDYHGLARKTDGTVWGWGGNAQGQVGDGTKTTQCTPVQVAGVSNVETIGAGMDHSLVTLTDGTVWGWGNNDQGQLGVGDTTPHLAPTQMRGENGVGFLNLKMELLTVNTTGTGSGTVGGAGYYLPGATVTLTATPNTGSTFADWSPNPCAASFTMPASALTCIATFTLNNYTLTLNQTGTGSGTVSGGGTYPYNTPVTTTATAATGSTFTGWSPSPCAPSFAMPANDLTCTATFTLNNYTLTVNQTGTGSGTVGGGGTFPYNTTVTPTATAATGSTFTGWNPPSCSNPFNLTTDTTCTATFTLNSYPVTATAGPHGRIAPAARTVNHGATTTFIVTPDLGYTATVTGCDGALVGETYYTTGPITAACTVTASFAAAGATAPITTGGDAFSVMNHASRILAYTTGLGSLGQLGAGLVSSPSQVRPQASFFRSVYPVRVS